MSHFIITGAKGGNTQDADAPNRLEINNLVKIQDQFSLYIQALDTMYSEQQSNDISFFGIGGIHGLPYVQWDGSGSTKPVSSWGGYCHHGSTLFPTWHRPYVALFEQVLQQHAIAIAEKYTVDQERWKAAAANLRAPYWDWAANSVPPAEVISLTTVNIIKPDGTLGPVANPLLKYAFHPIDSSFTDEYSMWPTTLRHPTSFDSPNATSNINELKSDLSTAQDGITTNTYNLLTRVHTWPAFSNHTPGDGDSSSNSLEAIHDDIHDDIGAGGHMSNVAMAGFDPIFFLHHANVDRMLSLWSALNPTVWVSEGPATGGTFTVPPNTLVDANTSLTPFWDSQTGYWASSETTVTSKLGYTYPEFNGLNMGNSSVVQDAIAQVVNQLYGGPIFNLFSQTGPSTTNLLASRSLAPSSSDAQASGTSESAVTPGSGGDGSVSMRSIDPASAPALNSFYDWTARIRVKKYTLGGSFSVLIFLGEVPEDPRSWRSSPSFVGAHHAFVNSAAEQCENCRNQADLVIEGFVHLNTAIAQRSGLGSFEPAVVEPYLKRELSWRIQKADRTAVNVPDVPSLEVVVSATLLTLEPGAMFPTPGECHYHHRITVGRPGGSQPA
ncbi:photo-regulated tyrosinase [Armillaria novae-zelandiae]|uniref:Photo-regulated tyrosinase n=1 Tax=Armillaria novae-zelandiae TaxID=153914 RepID=A0AA39P9P0_9AGAR|nr:photo-regulated tyrosinase [Armillaria novae-zelandiae]